MTEFVPNLRSFRGGFMNDSNGKAMGYIVYSGYMLLRCVAPQAKCGWERLTQRFVVITKKWQI